MTLKNGLFEVNIEKLPKTKRKEKLVFEAPECAKNKLKKAPALYRG